MRPILYHQQAGSLDQLGGPESRGSDGQNPVRIAVNDQCGHVDATQIVAEVLMPCRHAGEAGRGRGAGSDVPAGLHRLFADALTEQEVCIVEILEEIGEERVTVCGDRFLDSLEDTAVHALRVVRRLQQERRNTGDDNYLAHALRSIFPQVARHFTATHRETDQREITQFEPGHEFVQVFGESIIVVAGCWLARLAEPSAVIRDDTVT